MPTHKIEIIQEDALVGHPKLMMSVSGGTTPEKAIFMLFMTLVNIAMGSAKGVPTILDGSNGKEVKE